MSTHSYSFAAIALACSLSCNAEPLRELQVHGALSPSKQASLNLQASSADLTLTSVSQGRWSYTFVNPRRVVAVAVVGLDGAPSPYTADPLRIRLPYASDGPLVISVIGVDVKDTPERVRQIFATPVGGDAASRLQDMFGFYQETAALARNRLAEINAGRPFYVYDAQVFFKYLEVARELGRQANVVLSDGVLDVKRYVRAQLEMSSGRAVIERAIPRGAGDVKTLLVELDFVDAEQMRKVWRWITTKTPAGSAERCFLYAAFLETIASEQFDQGLVSAWEANKGYGLVKLATDASNECASKLTPEALTADQVDRVRESVAALEAASVSLSAHPARPGLRDPARVVEQAARRLRLKF